MSGSLFSHTEAELIYAARRGDGAAFADLLRPQFKAAFRVAYGLLHDASEAEDVVQEASFKAWRRLGNLREGTSLKPWFLAIVANQCRGVSGSRWWAVRKAGDPQERDTRSVDVAAAVDLRMALRRLGHDDRLVVVLRYYLDMPFEEIAVTLGITPTAAKHRIERAVHRLRPMVQSQGAAI